MTCDALSRGLRLSLRHVCPRENVWARLFRHVVLADASRDPVAIVLLQRSSLFRHGCHTVLQPHTKLWSNVPLLATQALRRRSLNVMSVPYKHSGGEQTSYCTIWRNDSTHKRLFNYSQWSQGRDYLIALNFCNEIFAVPWHVHLQWNGFGFGGPTHYQSRMWLGFREQSIKVSFPMLTLLVWKMYFS